MTFAWVWLPDWACFLFGIPVGAIVLAICQGATSRFGREDDDEQL